VCIICIPTSVELDIAELLSQHAKRKSLTLKLEPKVSAENVTLAIVVLTPSLFLGEGSIYAELCEAVTRRQPQEQDKTVRQEADCARLVCIHHWLLCCCR
jgi:hypothetical protein